MGILESLGLGNNVLGQGASLGYSNTAPTEANAVGGTFGNQGISGDFMIGNPKKSDMPMIFWIGAAVLGAAVLYRTLK